VGTLCVEIAHGYFPCPRWVFIGLGMGRGATCEDEVSAAGCRGSISGGTSIAGYLDPRFWRRMSLWAERFARYDGGRRWKPRPPSQNALWNEL
jgi:hypothetical protein